MREASSEVGLGLTGRAKADGADPGEYVVPNKHIITNTPTGHRTDRFLVENLVL